MKKTAEMGLFLALALILSYVESLLPLSFGIPGVKLGLPNLIVVLLLYRGDARQAGLINFLRIMLSGFLFSNLYGIIYALAGAVFSLTAMLLGKRTGWFSIVGVSVLGGVLHNIGQILVAMMVVETFLCRILYPLFDRCRDGDGGSPGECGNGTGAVFEKSFFGERER